MKEPAGRDANATGSPPENANGDDPFGLSPWLKEMPGMPANALMANPVAAMAATTAIGLSIAGQMAGFMLGMMQRAAGAPDEAKDAARPAPDVAQKAARESATPRKSESRPARKAPVSKRTKSDDLKAISGIGPKLEQMLNGMGFRRYADIAALKAADVARVDMELGLDGRIVRDGWVEKARTLAKGRG